MKKRPPLAERIKRGLQQAIAFERGEITLRTKEVKIPAPPQNLSADDITRIRKKLGYSQAVLAKVAAVSVQTVQGWERGARRPSGTASRLLQLLGIMSDLAKNLQADIVFKTDCDLSEGLEPLESSLEDLFGYLSQEYYNVSEDIDIDFVLNPRAYVCYVVVSN